MDIAGSPLLRVILFLDPKSATQAQTSSRTGVLGRVAAATSPVWRRLAKRTFDLDSLSGCFGPRGENCNNNWARVFALWYAASEEVGIEGIGCASGEPPLPARWIAAWGRMRRWLLQHAPEMLPTLRPGEMDVLGRLDPAQHISRLDPAENKYGGLRGLLGMWRVYDGQSVPMDTRAGRLVTDGTRGMWRSDGPLGDGLSTQSGDWLGIFGGYAVYDHCVSTSLLPLGLAMKITTLLHRHNPDIKLDHPSKIAFACSFNLHKLLFVDTTDGAVYVFPTFELAVPLDGGVSESEEVNLHAQMWAPESAPGLLRWFEEYVRRLEQGLYAKQPLMPHISGTSSICLLPASGPDTTCCVTRGVEVTSTVVYMPEHVHGWTYAIGFRLVGSDAERGYQTCQLHTRTWIIQEEGQPVEQIDGEGVIGFFPILTSGGWLLNEESDPHENLSNFLSDLPIGFVSGPFRYQSCSGRLRSMWGTFGGYLTFIPGTIDQPTGEPFQVRLATFPLRVPTYLYREANQSVRVGGVFGA